MSFCVGRHLQSYMVFLLSYTELNPQFLIKISLPSDLGETTPSKPLTFPEIGGCGEQLGQVSWKEIMSIDYNLFQTLSSHFARFVAVMKCVRQKICPKN